MADNLRYLFFKVVLIYFQCITYNIKKGKKNGFGNLFQEESLDLLVLDTKEITDPVVLHYMLVRISFMPSQNKAWSFQLLCLDT